MEATGEDAAASDVGVSNDVAVSSDVLVSSDGARRDASDASDASDATINPDVAADGVASDVLGPPDVVDEPPPHCGGAFTCAPGVPSGWSGPLELYAGSSVAPPCGPNFAGPALDANDNLSAPAAKCDCQCQSPQGVQCASPPISFYGSAACSVTNSCGAIVLTPGVCTAVDVRSKCADAGLITSMSAPASTVSAGTCAPLAGKSVPLSSWGVNARACSSSLGLAQGDCAAGSEARRSSDIIR